VEEKYGIYNLSQRDMKLIGGMGRGKMGLCHREGEKHGIKL